MSKKTKHRLDQIGGKVVLTEQIFRGKEGGGGPSAAGATVSPFLTGVTEERANGAI